MTTPATTIALVPAIETLGDVLKWTSDSYQQLLTQPDSYSFYHEAGRNLRYLAARYAEVLVSALDCLPEAEAESGEEYGDWSNEDDTSLEEDTDDD